MKILNSGSVQLLVTDYRYQGTQYRVASPYLCFSLSKGRIINPQNFLEKFLKAYPDLILDEGLPKLSGEWQIFGKAYRKTNTDKNLVRIVLGDSVKSSLVDFVHAQAPELDLRDAKNARFFTLYEEKISTSYRDMTVQFADLDPGCKERLALFGGVSKEQFFSFPDNFSYEYSYVAPRDQRISSYWKGNESYELQGVLPSEVGEYVYGKLPEAKIRVYCISFDDKSAIKPDLNLDTIKFFPDLDVGVMVWRGIFKIEPDHEPDMLLVACLSDYATDPDQETFYDDQFFLKMGIDALEPEKDPEAPVKKVKEQVKTVKKQSKKTIVARRCGIYNEYFDFEYAFDGVPKLLPLSRELISSEERQDMIGRFTNTVENIEKYSKDRSFEDMVAPTMDIIAKGGVLPAERNFQIQLSALLLRGTGAERNSEFRELHKSHPLNSFTIKRYRVAYLQSAEIHAYSDWGIDQKGTFTVPSGTVIPECYGKDFTSAYILPHGLYDCGDFIPIPGSEITDYVSWHNTLNPLYGACFLVSDLEEGLLMNEEAHHYLNIIVMPDANSKLPEQTAKFLEGCELIYRAVPDEVYYQEKEKWSSSTVADVQVIPLRCDHNGNKFSSLKDVLLRDDTLFDDWFHNYYPFPISEPNHVTVGEYEAAFYNLLAKKTGVNPKTLNFEERANQILEDKKKEVLSFCHSKREREATEQAFAKSKAEMAELHRMSDIELVEKAAANQLQNIETSAEFLKNKGQYDVSAMKADLQEGVRQFKEAYQKCNDDFKALNEHLENMKTRVSGTPEEIAQRTNLDPEEISMLCKQGARNLSSLYITRQKWVNLKLREMVFRDTVFDEVDFSGTDFSYNRFENCTFTNCFFVENTVPKLAFIDCSFTDSTMENIVCEDGLWENCRFDFCNISRVRFIKGNLKSLNCSTTSVKDSEWTETILANCSFDFCKLEHPLFSKSDFHRVFFSSSQISEGSFKSSHGEILSFSRCNFKMADFSETVFKRIEFEKSFIDKMKASQCHWIGLTCENTQAPKIDLSNSVLEKVYVRECDFSEGNFRKTVSKEATFTLSILRKADFFHANLFRADFSGSKLGMTLFREANLFEADFNGIALKDNDFSGADLRRTLLDKLAN